jgi:hypothetical protein
MADLDAVIALPTKARQLHNKAHFERGVEKWRAALAAAEALGEEDCVILVALQTKAVRASLYAQELRGVRTTQASVLDAFAQYAASAAVLRRRRDAGTLLEGKCRPDEVRWQLETLRSAALFMAAERNVPAASCAELMPTAALVGYDTFLHVADSCGQLVCAALIDCVFEPGEEAEQTMFSFTCDLFDEAVALMVLPRVDDHRSSYEYNAFDRLRKLVARMPTGPAHRLWRVRVAVALARLHHSGVLEMRCIGGTADMRSVALAQQRAERCAQERADAAASRQLRSCALASCGSTEAHISHFKFCGACKAVAYCCREHQVADWPAHKAACKAARKAAAAAEDAA